LFVAHSDGERQQVLQSVGPFWDGNQAWLLADGGTLYFAFPSLYAASFSGFYLPLMIVLWLLMLRGISIEFRSHVESPVWRPLWDVVLGGARRAAGDILRSKARWASWTRARSSSALAAFATLTLHGALWVALKTEALLEDRCPDLRSVRGGWARFWLCGSRW
jgi:cytochrome d ubiquinol oxidase subunit II